MNDEFLNDEETNCPNCGQSIDGEDICPNCGAILKHEDEFNGFEDEDNEDF